MRNLFIRLRNWFSYYVELKRLIYISFIIFILLPLSILDFGFEELH